MGGETRSDGIRGKGLQNSTRGQKIMAARGKAGKGAPRTRQEWRERGLGAAIVLPRRGGGGGGRGGGVAPFRGPAA